jgi:hypothetical protein
MRKLGLIALLICSFAFAQDFEAVNDSYATLQGAIRGALADAGSVAHYIPGYGLHIVVQSSRTPKDPQEAIDITTTLLQGLSRTVRGLGEDDYISVLYWGFEGEAYSPRRTYEFIVRWVPEQKDSLEVWLNGIPQAPGATHLDWGPSSAEADVDTVDIAETSRLPGDSYEDQRRRPIVAILDNANPSAGRQSGLREASLIYEMPIEGNLTRLMTVYDRADPGRIGPIRSLHVYQHTIAEDMGGAIVHEGGSPAALDAIARGRAPSFNALERPFEELYSRASDATAPYDLYSDGARLRSFLRGANLETTRSLRGTIYRPAPELPDSGALQVSYPGGYSSGFTYLPELNLYRWQRSGVAALDAGGEGVVVQAVVVARVAGAPIPGDREGRLYLAVDRGGEATLYLGGKRIEGRWQQQGGFQFTAEDGQPVDLAPFKTWIMMVPSWAQLASQ